MVREPKDAEPRADAASARRLDNGKGLVLMAAGMFAFSAVDASAKFLSETMHPLQIVWTRQIGLLLGVVVLLLWRGLGVLRSAKPGLQIVRGGLAVVSATLFVVAVSFAPLADAVAVGFLAPFFVTVMAGLILREPIGIRRWTAVAIGFIGAMIVIRPGFGVAHPALLLVVVAAALFAARQVLSRFLSGVDSVETTVAYTALVGGLLLTLPLPFIWRWPSGGQEIAILIGAAVLAALGEILVIKALETAQAVVVAPVQYSMLIWGVFYGYVLFDQLPDFWTWIGAAIIMASGLYTLHREWVVSRRRHETARDDQTIRPHSDD